LQTISGIGGVLGAVGGLGRIFGNKNLAKTTSKINTALSGTSQILRATDTLMTSKNIGQLFGSINSLIGGANRIVSVTSNSSKASGMFSLPGGPLSVGSLVNKSLGNLGIPRNPYLSGMVTNAVTSALNNIAFPKSVAGAAGLSTLAGLSGTSLSNSFSKLQTTGQSLTSFALSGLPPGASAELNAAMGAIGFGGASAIKMPSIGINTNALGEVQSQVTSLLGDPRIPAPDFGEVVESAAEQLQSILQQNNQVDGMLSEISNLSDQIDNAEENYFNLENTLPRGDPQLEAARQQWIALVDQLESKLVSIDNIIGSA
jgi:hypothetical protein